MKHNLEQIVEIHDILQDMWYESNHKLRNETDPNAGDQLINKRLYAAIGSLHTIIKIASGKYSQQQVESILNTGSL